MNNISRKSSNTVWHNATVTRKRREKMNGHGSVILWFTGLSGAGKSSLAHAVEEELHQLGCRTFVFDGDNVRHGLCADLGFSAEDRVENIRRVGEMAKLFIETGVIALTAFISPFLSDRARVRSLVPHGDFLEIYCHCPLEICEQRDVKGLCATRSAARSAAWGKVGSGFWVRGRGLPPARRRHRPSPSRLWIGCRRAARRRRVPMAAPGGDRNRRTV